MTIRVASRAQGLYSWLKVYMHGSRTVRIAVGLYPWPEDYMHDSLVLSHAHSRDAMHGSRAACMAQCTKFHKLKVATETVLLLTYRRLLCPVHSRPGRGCASQQRHTPPCAAESLLSCCCSQHCRQPTARRSLYLHPVPHNQ